MNVPKMDFDYAEIKRFIRNSHPDSKVYLGCDSVRKEVRGKPFAIYSTVVCIHKAEGGGVMRGCKVFHSTVRLPDYGKVIRSGKLANLKARMLQEVAFTLEVFDGLQDVLEDREWEIHVDINSKKDCESNVALADAKGYVMGVTGKEPKFKPYGLAASFAADAAAHGYLN